jgi:protein-S-isoprenylcysteine O-methyltransferase
LGKIDPYAWKFPSIVVIVGKEIFVVHRFGDCVRYRCKGQKFFTGLESMLERSLLVSEGPSIRLPRFTISEFVSMSLAKFWEWFPSPAFGWLFVASFIAWWGTEAIYLPRGTDSSRQLRDFGSRLFNLASVYGSVGLCLIVRWLGWGSVDWRLQSLGIGLMLFGVLFRAWAIHVLGRHFSVHVAIQAEHQLVKTGPYRWLRHPAYTGTLLTLMGLPVALGVWPLAFAVGAFFIAAHIYRIRVEEAAMSEKFGEAYTNYCQKTWRMFPGW